ncbi:uncharacterized protein LOC104867008 [Fukomys damarensis]|uniref:uncharacterized protein LOC104867008 n=1 Tax=Fukomys damarensis TaxID=885580 RepID=UPI00053F34CA|nr:uncharacterized protein LOC104867008 [Fukomys damarensis]
MFLCAERSFMLIELQDITAPAHSGSRPGPSPGPDRPLLPAEKQPFGTRPAQEKRKSLRSWSGRGREEGQEVKKSPLRLQQNLVKFLFAGKEDIANALGVTRTHSTNGVLPRSPAARMIPGGCLVWLCSHFPVIAHPCLTLSRKGVENRRGRKKEKILWQFMVWRHFGPISQGSEFSPRISFSQTFFVSFVSMQAPCLSVFLLLPGTLTPQLWRQLFFPTLLLHIIAVGSDGSRGSLVERAKICSRVKRSGAAVAPAKHGQ